MTEAMLYPLFMHLAGRPVLVVGGGAVGLRKVEGLVAAGATVTVVSPHFAAPLADLPNVTLLRREYGPEIMQASRWRLAFAATDVAAVNEAVQQDAAAANILCCRCDEPDAGDFSGGATHHAAGWTLAVSTQGASPVLATRLRAQAIAAIDPVLGTWSELLAEWRKPVLAQVPDPAARRRLLRRLAGPEMEQCLRQHGADQARRCFTQWLRETVPDTIG